MRELRRKERAMDERDARELLRNCRHAVIAMIGTDGLPALMTESISMFLKNTRFGTLWTGWVAAIVLPVA